MRLEQRANQVKRVIPHLVTPVMAGATGYSLAEGNLPATIVAGVATGAFFLRDRQIARRKEAEAELAYNTGQVIGAASERIDSRANNFSRYAIEHNLPIYTSMDGKLSISQLGVDLHKLMDLVGTNEFVTGKIKRIIRGATIGGYISEEDTEYMRQVEAATTLIPRITFMLIDGEVDEADVHRVATFGEEKYMQEHHVKKLPDSVVKAFFRLPDDLRTAPRQT